MKSPNVAFTLLLWLAASIACLHAQVSGEQLTQGDVQLIIAQAATEAARIDPGALIAVTDREGFVLGVWDMKGRPPAPVVMFDLNTLKSPPLLRSYGLLAGAITRAGTAAFLSSDQQAFTSRTAGYIIQQHFPPAVRNTAPGPLVGVGFSSLFFSDINRLKQIANPLDPAMPFDPMDLRMTTAPADKRRISTGVRGISIPLGSLSDSPGGVPLYKNGHLVGGLGVTGDGTPTDLAVAAAFFLKEVQKFSATPGFVPSARSDADELVALAGQTGFRPSKDIVATRVLINGIRIPYVRPHVDDIADVRDVRPPGSLPGGIVADFPVQAPPPRFPYPVANLGGVDGELRGPVTVDPVTGNDVIGFIDDPVSTIPGRQLIGKASRLTASEVGQIIAKAAQRASITRAGIRLPVGTSVKVFISVVNNPNKDGEAPAVLGTVRVGEATIFSWDVSVQKARTAVFFSSKRLAMSARAVGFLAQSHYPPGLDGRPFGPFFGFQEAVTFKQAPGAAGGFPGNPNLPNGITIFPGGFPLYRNGELIGAVGVSGDGVDQDDIITASGCTDFLANPRIRADHFSYRGARLPYAKFPRNPVR